MVDGDAELSADSWLSRARQLAPAAIDGARAARGFAARWRSIAGKLDRVPSCLSDLSSHPCFAKNTLCREQLQSVCAALSDAVELVGRDNAAGKLRTQSDLDSLSARLDLILRDCALLVKTGVLGDSTIPSSASGDPEAPPPPMSNIRELLARLQIGHSEAKHQALDGLLDALRDDEKLVVSALGRGNVSALVHLLSATSPKIKEKASVIVCLITESGNCENSLVSEGALPPLIRLVESGTLVAREKAVLSLQRLSTSPDTARSIAGNGGIRPLVEMCQLGDSSVCQLAAAGTLTNLSAVPEIRQSLVEEGIVRVTIDLLDSGVVAGSKEYAAECLHNLTSSNDGIRRSVVSEGGVRSLLAYLDGPLPQESAVAALRNLAGSVSTTESLISLGLLPRLAHVLKSGSPGAKQAAAAIISKISASAETKRLVGESGCVGPLLGMLERGSGGREAAAQAVAGLMSCPQVGREVKRDERSVPSLVGLLDPSPHNAAKKYAVGCLLRLSSSKRAKRMMVSYGAIGYLKKLSEMEVPGSKKLLERLERGRIRSLFSRK